MLNFEEVASLDSKSNWEAGLAAVCETLKISLAA